jgi:hypothetical protein
VTTDQRVVAKQVIQEFESAKRAGAPYAHHRTEAKDTNTKLRQQLANAPRPLGGAATRRYTWTCSGERLSFRRIRVVGVVYARAHRGLKDNMAIKCCV